MPHVADNVLLERACLPMPAKACRICCRLPFCLCATPTAPSVPTVAYTAEGASRHPSAVLYFTSRLKSDHATGPLQSGVMRVIDGPMNPSTSQRQSGLLGAYTRQQLESADRRRGTASPRQGTVTARRARRTRSCPTRRRSSARSWRSTSAEDAPCRRSSRPSAPSCGRRGCARRSTRPLS